VGAKWEVLGTTRFDWDANPKRVPVELTRVGKSEKFHVYVALDRPGTADLDRWEGQYDKLPE